ncbi:PA2778 family cysteine peptidase [Kaarinaea lacus]
MIKRRKTASWCIGSLFLLNACSTTLEIDQLRMAPDARTYQRTEINNVPFYAQEKYQCGPAALAMLLSWSNQSTTPEELTSLVYVPGRKGSFQLEMIAATRSYNRIPYELSSGWQSLIAEVEAGNPVLVLQNLGLSWFPNWHYAVVKGIDIANNEIILHSGTNENYVINLQTFERTWQRAAKWAMVVMPAERLPASADAVHYIKAVSYFEQPGKLDVALRAYQTAVAHWPNEIVVLMGQGNVYYQLGQLEDAKTFYERAVAIDREFAPAHNNLAQVLFETGQLSEAYFHAQIAVRNGGANERQFRETLEQIELEQRKSGKD